MIGGISYFHAYAYDLLAANERIIAASCDAAIAAHANGRLKKMTYMSSSMVFETWDQHRLPYTIARPFNCVGIGESRALGDEEIMSGNVKLAMSHVVPDLVQKIVKGQDPLHILGSGDQIRHYTYGGDLARGIIAAMEHPDATNEDFNLSTAESTTVLHLAELIWRKVKGAGVPLRIVNDDPFEYDVQRRIPSTDKAKRLLGFAATTSLEVMLDEVVPWIAAAVDNGTI
jgi:UDP-glucose 4-epimerase